MGGEKKLNGPDLTQGVARSAIPVDGMLLGHAFGEAVLLSVIDGEVHAVGARCTHYGASLDKGLRVGDTVRCPWHHACFSLRTGEMLRTPALDPVPCFRVEQVDGVVHVREKLAVMKKLPLSGSGIPASIVIIGGGAAGNAAAEELRKQDYAGSITMISADDSVPYDRPNLSKDYLAGNAPEDWIPLRSAQFYEEHRIDVKLATRVVAIDAGQRKPRRPGPADDAAADAGCLGDLGHVVFPVKLVVVPQPPHPALRATFSPRGEEGVCRSACMPLQPTLRMLVD